MKKILFIALLFVSLVLKAEQHEVGLVLGGGGALGFAHIGAIQALEEAGYRPTIISGTSMGSLVGVLYANGYTPAEIMKIVRDERLYRNTTLLQLHASKLPGIYNLDKVRELLCTLMPHNSFDSLPKSFYACVTNLTEATPFYAHSGDLLSEYVIASASVPTIFEAQDIEGAQYIDGGMLNNFPAQPIREQCKLLIGIDVLPLTHKRAEKAIDAMLYGLRDVQHVNSLPGQALCDIVIEVPAIEMYTEFDFKYYNEIYQIGYEITKAQLESMKK